MTLPRRRFLHLTAGLLLPCHVALRLGAKLSVAAGALDRAVSTRRWDRHPRSLARSVAIGATRPAIRHRQSAGRRWQHRYRGGLTRVAGRLYTPPCRSVHTINPSLYDKLGFDFIRDIAPVAGIMRLPLVMVVHPSLPAKTVPEFIVYARANPGKINVASAGNGTSQHLAGELFKIMAGIDMVHVPYRGTAPALTDLLGGQVQVCFATPGPSIEYVRVGKLRGLAVTSAARSPALPDLPTVGDFLPGFEASLMYGFGVPTNTPPEIVDRLNSEINAGLADPDVKARLADLDGTVLGGSPADFGKLIAEETEKWRPVIRLANIKLE